jgi:hypothetical protein
MRISRVRNPLAVLLVDPGPDHLDRQRVTDEFANTLVAKSLATMNDTGLALSRT